MGNDQERVELDFVSSVRSNFAFLETEFGYKCVEINAHKFGCADVRGREIVYAWSQNSVVLWHDIYAYEIDVYVNIHTEAFSRKYSMYDISSVVAPEFKSQFQACTQNGLDCSLRTIADIIRTRCPGLLKGDNQAIEVFDAVREQLAAEARDKVMRNSADQAWRKKDYAEVVRLYESFKAKLTQLEEQRLAFSRRKK